MGFASDTPDAPQGWGWVWLTPSRTKIPLLGVSPHSTGLMVRSSPRPHALYRPASPNGA